MLQNLTQYYEILTHLQGWTGLAAKVCLLSILAAVAGGNRRPGERVLTMVFAALFFRVFIALFLRNEIGQFDISTEMLPVAVPAFVLCLVFVIATLKPEGEWTVLHPQGWKKWLGLLLLGWAFYYPLFSGSLVSAVLFSPMGVLPAPVILAAGTLAWLSFPNTPRLAGWAVSLGLVYFGIVEVLAGVGSSVLLLVMGAGLGGQLAYSAMKAGGVLGDDVPPVDRQARSSRKDKKDGTKEARTWKLK